MVNQSIYGIAFSSSFRGRPQLYRGRNPEPSVFAFDGKVTGFRIAAARRPE